MQLEVSQKSEISQCQEIEAMKDTLLKLEDVNQQLRMHDEEQHRKEMSRVSEVCVF